MRFVFGAILFIVEGSLRPRQLADNAESAALKAEQQLVQQNFERKSATVLSAFANPPVKRIEVKSREELLIDRWDIALARNGVIGFMDPFGRLFSERQYKEMRDLALATDSDEDLIRVVESTFARIMGNEILSPVSSRASSPTVVDEFELNSNSADSTASTLNEFVHNYGIEYWNAQRHKIAKERQFLVDQLELVGANKAEIEFKIARLDAKKAKLESGIFEGVRKRDARQEMKKGSGTIDLEDEDRWVFRKQFEAPPTKEKEGSSSNSRLSNSRYEAYLRRMQERGEKPVSSNPPAAVSPKPSSGRKHHGGLQYKNKQRQEAGAK